MKYLIREVPSRHWYVGGYLVPSMVKQGIKKEDILVYTDSEGEGNLQSLISAYKKFGVDDYWLMNDDVMISSDFAEKTQNHDDYEVICGFAAKCCHNADMSVTTPTNMWYSFPCIFVSKQLNAEFYVWLLEEAPTIVPDCFWFRKGCGDDALFKSFLTYKHINLKVKLLKPNIINHVDYLLGGSIVSPQRTADSTSAYWNEPELLDKLEKKLKGRIYK